MYVLLRKIFGLKPYFNLNVNFFKMIFIKWFFLEKNVNLILEHKKSLRFLEDFRGS